MFLELYHLPNSPNNSVAEARHWVGDSWHWNVSFGSIYSFGLEWLKQDFLGWVEEVKLHPNTDDKFVWRPDPTRVFTVKSCYNLLVDVVPEEPVCDSLRRAFRDLWNLKIPSKILIFGWRVLLNRLPTKDHLFKKRIISSASDILCVLCLDEEESLDHLFLRCVVSKKIWRGIFVWFGMDEVSFANYIDAFNFHYDVFHKFFSSSKATTIWLATCRSIWLGRIIILFRSFVINVDEIVVSYKLLSWNWLVIGNMDITLCSFMD